MPYRILIVEDDALIGLDLECMIEDAGYDSAGVARNMAAALRVAARGGVDLATIDIRLAGGDNGVDVALQLWTKYNIRCLFVSGSLDRAIRERAAPAHPIGFIAKPVRTGDVAIALNARFARPSC